MQSKEAKIIEYLQSLIFDSKIEEMPQELSDIDGLKEIDFSLRSLRQAIMAIGNGDLDKKIEGRGYTIGTVKNLQSTLKNLIWHSKAVSEGDFSQEVIFLGDFSEAFNVMTANIAKMFVELEESEERHRLLADNADDVVWTMDLAGNLTYMSPSVEKVRGYTVEEVMVQSTEEQICPGSLCKLDEGIGHSLSMVAKNLPFGVFREDIELPHKDGSTIWADLTISGMYDKSNKCVGMLGVYKNITLRKNLENETKTLSETDKLTQIYNRLKLDEALKIEMKRFLRGGATFSVILLDIDYFKEVNDNYGHLVGDRVLVEIAKIIKTNIRVTDTVGRWGGEEFLIITPISEAKNTKILAEKMREKIANHEFPHIGHITASFGVADSQGLNDEATLISRADTAMYESKNTGRNKVSVFAAPSR